MFWLGLAFLLMVFDHRGSSTRELRAALSMPLSLLEYAVSWPVQLFDKMSDTVSSHDALLRENIDLKSQQLLLKAQVQRLLALESENNQLKSLMRSSTQVSGKVLVAQILSVDADPFVNQVIVDKGSHDGVFVGQPVLDANGVMGKIIQVGPITSRLLLITDSHSGVPVQVTRSGMRAIAMGDAYSSQLRLVNVPQTADIREGDILLTSGLGEHFPPGYPVGKVITVIKDPAMQFATITLQPSAQPERSQQVLLVWPSQKSSAFNSAAAKLPDMKLADGGIKSGAL